MRFACRLVAYLPDGVQTPSNMILRLPKALEMAIYAIPKLSGDINAFKILRLIVFNLIRVEKILRHLITNPANIIV